MNQTEQQLSTPPYASGHRQGMIWVEVTNGCNLNCSHCYSDSFPGSHVRDKMTHDDYIRVVKESADMGMSTIQFIGGEPLLYKQLPELVTLAQDSGFLHVEIFSNLVASRPDVFDAIDPAKTTVATSVYSDKASVHDQIVKRLGSFQRTTGHIKELALRGIGVRAGFIEMDVNEGQFEQTKEFLMSLGVQSVGFDRVRGFGRAGDSSEASMSELCGSCAGNTLCVTYEGEVLPCIMSRSWPIGNILSESLGEIAASHHAASVRSQISEATHLSRMTGLFDSEQLGIQNCEPNICTPNCQPGCQPWCAPSCQPACYPGQSCSPCQPYGSIPCAPNGRCQPTG